ncbi:hypothetical protein DPEC_G00028760 [Dallia pectoralis]|uniref:Uncharacterized protein n=1 Tax=Dallia pectoralis TaxID=75939 RepID=A0ACC2HIL1_DALPE|nr:hypothetical protein DPEC_G00028760 [Dallia pectoralis]
MCRRWIECRFSPSTQQEREGLWVGGTTKAHLSWQPESAPDTSTSSHPWVYGAMLPVSSSEYLPTVRCSQSAVIPQDTFMSRLCSSQKTGFNEIIANLPNPSRHAQEQTCHWSDTALNNPVSLTEEEATLQQSDNPTHEQIYSHTVDGSLAVIGREQVIVALSI